MSRKLDLSYLWQMAVERGLSPEAVASRAGVRLSDRNTVTRLGELEDLTARELVAIADVLELTVDELLTTDDAGEEPDTAEPGADAPAIKHRASTSQADADILQAALLRFRSLPEQTLSSAVLTAERLNTAIAALHRRWAGKGMRVRRVAGWVELQPEQDLPDKVAETLSTRLDDASALRGEETPFLIVAVRAHALGSYPGAPRVPWHVCQFLLRQGAVMPPSKYATVGRPVRLVPHPDLLFALHLADEPASLTSQNDTTARQSPIATQ